MVSKRFHMLGSALVILVLLASCNMPNANPAEPAVVVVATVQEEADTPTPQPEPPTATPAPTETVTITLTPEPSFTPTETMTLTPSVVMAEVLKETNCRTGPGSMYDRVATFQAGTKVEIVAADLGGGYWYVKNPEKAEEFCWMWGNNMKIEGETSILPAFTPPSTPTPSPDFTVEFKNYDTCKGVFVRFTVVNTGGFQFRSAYIKVTDVKSKEVTQQAVNAFDLTTGCVVAKNIAPLTPGSTGYLQSAPFKKDPRGDKLNAVFQLCTEQGLKGTCITKVIEVKPK